MNKKFIILCCLCFVIFGCVGKKIKVTNVSDKQVPIVDNSITGTPVTVTPVLKTDIPSSSQPLSVEEPDIHVKKLEKNVLFVPIYFDFDNSDIKPEYRNILETYAKWLKNNEDYNVLVEGHTDDRGTIKYNLALGQERASKVRSYLAYLDISAKRIATVSYGSERPICSDENEAAWAKNRRAEFLLYKNEQK